MTVESTLARILVQKFNQLVKHTKTLLTNLKIIITYYNNINENKIDCYFNYLKVLNFVDVNIIKPRELEIGNFNITGITLFSCAMYVYSINLKVKGIHVQDTLVISSDRKCLTFLPNINYV